MSDHLSQLVRYCFVLNAGAIVALLAFLGPIIPDDGDPAELIKKIRQPLWHFEWGIGLSLATVVLQFFFARYKSQLVQSVALIPIELAVVFFLSGANTAVVNLAEIKASTSAHHPQA